MCVTIQAGLCMIINKPEIVEDEKYVTVSSRVDIQDSTIASSASYGIRVPCNSTAVVTNTSNTFTACASGNVGPGPECN